jgi:hypothetical protein
MGEGSRAARPRPPVPAENLQVLCPNCHSQTENFAGRNARARATAEGVPSREDSDGREAA